MKNTFTVSLSSIGLAALAFLMAGCGIYKFNDVSIDPRARTVNIKPVENRARYVNPQLKTALTDRIRQKVVNQTRLSQVETDTAHYVVEAVVTDYFPTTSGVSNTQNGRQASIARLTVRVQITIQDNLENKDRQEEVTRAFDYPATQTLQAAEAALFDDIVRNISDEIFNRIFSKW